MPEIPQQPDGRPIADAGEEGVHQRDPGHLGRVLRGVGIGDHQPDIMSYDADTLVPEGRGEGANILRHGLLVVTACRLRGIPEAAQIGRDHHMRLGKLRDERTPHMTGLGVPVQEQHRIAFASNQVVHPDAVDIREAALGRNQLLSRRGRHDHRCDKDACQHP